LNKFVKKQKLQHWILTADLIWAIVAMVLAYVLRYGFRWHGSSDSSFLTYVPPLLVAMSLWLAIFSSMKLDGFRRGWHLPAIFSQLFLAVTVLMMVLFAGGYLFRVFVSRLTFTYFGFLLLLGFLAIRYVVHSILSSSFLTKAVRQVVIVGNGPVAREMAAKIERHPEMLCRVVGFLFSADTSFDMRTPGLANESFIVQALGVVELLRERRVNEIIITLSRPGVPEVVNLASACRQAGIGVSVVPHPYELYLSKPQLLDIGGLPVLQLREADESFANSLAKRGLDIILDLGLLLISIPAVVVGAVMLLHKSGGPFCRELRCGRHGNPFRMWRLNSDRDCGTLPRFEVILQQLSITELPQLWNVLRGEMSLVGPRPESPERVKHYSDWQRQRLNVKPGMTGLAQVHGLREQHSSEEKARFDLQYIMQSSFFFDISLMLQTFWTLMGRLLHLYRLGSRIEDVGQRSPSENQFLERTLPGAHSTQSSTD
jgi:lipopolysaccharide/colanic/teichoic acid biosynthesis glycosyltransferase